MLPTISKLFKAYRSSREQVYGQEEVNGGVNTPTDGVSEDKEDDQHDEVNNDESICWTDEDKEDVLESDSEVSMNLDDSESEALYDDMLDYGSAGEETARVKDGQNALENMTKEGIECIEHARE